MNKKRRVNDVILALENKESFTNFSSKSKTEKEFRDEEVPWPKSEEQLLSYIRSLVNKNHDYGTCVYAMSMAAVSAFYYVCSKLGVSGFQSSCADLDILKRLRNFKLGFKIINYEDLLYPQNDVSISEDNLIKKNLKILAKEAKKLLKTSNDADIQVKERWQYIIKLNKNKSIIK